jgi:transcriptional regulator with XRE-family HTH domain
MADLMIQFGKRIKQVRKAAKLTQEHLAEKTGLSTEYISRLERGVAQPSFDTFAVIADTLNVTYRDLLDFRGPILFKDEKQEAKLRKEYLDTITAELGELDSAELKKVRGVIRAIADK